MKQFFILPVLMLFVAEGSRAAEPSLALTLPPRWFAVVGVPMSVYFDNMVLTEQPESYRFEVKCDLGRTEARRWTVTPTDRQVGDHSMRVSVKDAQGKLLQEGRTTLRVVPRRAGENRSVRLLIVGDSLTHASAYPNEIARHLSEPGNPKWAMLGTHQPAGVMPGVAHEGYGGWTWAAFLTKFDPAPPAPAGNTPGPKSTSPFIYGDLNGKAGLDIPRYFREHCEGQPPDAILFLLGINDCFGAKPDDRAALDQTINATLDNAEKLLAAFRQAAPKAVFAVGLTPPPNSREEGFIANYKGQYHRWGWKRIQHRLVQRMLERFGRRESEGIQIVPTELNIDPVEGYPVDNGVHPNAAGYAQIGTSFYAWLKAWVNQP